MQGIVFFIVNESEIIFASNSEIAVNNFKNAREYEDFNETASELGKDDMLSDRDIIETSFMSGFNNGIYYIDSVDLDNKADEYEFETSEGDRFYYSELEEVYEYIDED